MLRKILFGLSAASLLTGCSGQQEMVYPLAPKEVRSILVDAKTMDFSVETMFDLALSKSDHTGIHWRVVPKEGMEESEGQELARLIARIEEVEPGQTRVTVSAGPPQTERERIITAKMPNYGKMLRFFEAAMAEQIDARLENRPFNATAITGQAVAAMSGMISDVKSGAGEAAKNAYDRTHQSFETDAETAAGLHDEAAAAEDYWGQPR